MNWEDAIKYMQNHPETILLDVRPLPEHLEQRIPGSLHLNYLELTRQSAEQALGNTQAAVLVYCRTGLHSAPATDRLLVYGYNAIDAGSISDWPGELEGSMT